MTILRRLSRRHAISPSAGPGRQPARAAGRLGAAACVGGAVLLGVGLFAAQSVTSGVVLAQGNPNFHGVLSATNPTGFVASPTPYDLSGGPITITYTFEVTNKSAATHTFDLWYAVNHILTYKGEDVSAGEPVIDFNGTNIHQTTQELFAPRTPVHLVVPPKGSAPVTLTFHTTFHPASASNPKGDCGYYQIDVGDHADGHGHSSSAALAANAQAAPVDPGANGQGATLTSAFVRFVGCAAPSTPTPSPTPSGTTSGSVSATTTTGAATAVSTVAGTSPTASVSALSQAASVAAVPRATGTAVPSTGSEADVAFFGGIGLLGVGVLLIGVAAGLRREVVAG